MIKTGVTGVGKMGISHFGYSRPHPDVRVVRVADTLKLVTDVLQKYTSFNCYIDYRHMLDEAKPEAVFVAVPTKYHCDIVHKLVRQNVWLTKWDTTINL